MNYKYDEDTILKELGEYITKTYTQHYSAGEAFCRSNILKYASRYDRKGSARRDIIKILHYAILLLHFNDKNANRESYTQ